MVVTPSDLELALDVGAAAWPALRGARVLLTGGTGFFGVWLLATLQAADRRYELGVTVDVVSRAPDRFVGEHPSIAAWPGLSWITGDVRSFVARRPYTHAMLGATAASAALNAEQPLEMFDVIVAGARHSLAQLRDRPRVLLVSSGAVYGRQPPELDEVPETRLGQHDPLDPGNAYAIGKLAAEHLASAWGRGRGADVVIARPFAFAGAGLPLDAHFAIGNFVGDAAAGRDIQVKGDGTAIRSYLYAPELAAWLWVLLTRGEAQRAYNVGSAEAVSIATLATIVAASGGVGFRIEGVPVPGAAAARYVPDVRRVGEELDLVPRIGVRDGVARMLAAVRGG